MKRDEYLKIQEELSHLLEVLDSEHTFTAGESNACRAAVLACKDVLRNHNPDRSAEQSRDWRILLNGVAEVPEGMNAYYFTYGTHEAFPFYRGHTKIYAPSEEAACQIFRAYHPNKPGSSALNCAFVYTQQKFEKTEMFQHPDEKCHEIIGAFPAENQVVQCIGCKHRDTVLCPMSGTYEDFPWKDTRDFDFCSYGKNKMK